MGKRLSPNQRFFWLRLNETFFTNRFIQRLKREPNADALIVIFLSTATETIKSEGYFRYEHYEDSIEEELAVAINRDPEEVKRAIALFEKLGAFERIDDDTLFIPFILDSIYSITESAIRSQKHRLNKAQKEGSLGEVEPVIDIAGNKLVSRENCTEALSDTNPLHMQQLATDSISDRKKKEMERKEEKRKSFSSSAPTITEKAIEYLNARSGSSFNPYDNESASLVEHLSEQGYTLDDIKYVIDIKCEEWLPNPHMASYLRPSTLFGEKFEKYRQQPRAIQRLSFNTGATTIPQNPFDLLLTSSKGVKTS